MSIGTGHGAAEPELAPGEPLRASQKWKFALVGLVGIYILLAAYDLISGFSAFGMNTTASAVKTASSAITRAKPASPSAVAPTSPAPAVRTASGPAPRSLAVASIAAFGPEGTSDGDNPGIVSRILGGSTGQPWYSQWYATPEFGDLRPGTGILLNMGEAVTVRDVQLVLGNEQGADVQVRVGSSPSLDLPTVASAAGVGGAVQLAVAAPAKGQYVLIWFTRLPSDGQGHYQVSVYGVLVNG